jgi:DNA-binding NtrC family response regulator
VLVVDDEQAIRLLCRVNLELDGYVVLEAGTLDEARERLGAGGVDVLLLDLHLGGERAYGLIAECSSRTPRVPVAVVSGSADLTEAERAGADAVLPKPFEIDALTTVVRSLAARGAAAG